MNNADKDLLYDLHNYGANVDTREIFLHNYYASDDTENPGVEYRMSNNFLKNIRALERKSNKPIPYMQSVGGEWSDGRVIYDAIVMSKCFITIIAYGQAESMSSIHFKLPTGGLSHLTLTSWLTMVLLELAVNILCTKLGYTKSIFVI